TIFGGPILEETPDTGPSIAGIFHTLNSPAPTPCEHLIRVTGRFSRTTGEPLGMIGWQHPQLAAYAAAKLSRWVERGEEFELPIEEIDEMGSDDAQRVWAMTFSVDDAKGRINGNCLFAADPDTFVTDAIARCDKFASDDPVPAGGRRSFADASQFE